MRLFLAGVVTIGMAFAAGAEEIESAYTDINAENDCTVFAMGQDGEDWSNLVCSGYKGYPVFIYYSDARESLFYGFPQQGDLAPAWESFSSFNEAGPKVEWRISRDGDRSVPFATIHRWFVSGPESVDEETEVLVVERVGQIGEWEGCAVGYVVATGNPGANEKARRIADNQARDFACGADQPVIDAGDVPVPDFTRADNG
ncbi:hypothetical protein [Nitratireductor thuwali]|uniref:Uncharacterized protein n=1 Tax=Nitratireductor thuwali TaxID=2267699 RepID=A0ABY5MJH1_9HYPH|nr:hypothetical protein NTH_01898 [Nitratireductor thuwali]